MQNDSRVGEPGEHGGSGAQRIVIEPQFCPLCGARSEAVRHITANVFETLCEECGYPCVVLSNDHQRFSSLAPEAHASHVEKKDGERLKGKSPQASEAGAQGGQK